MNIIFFRHNQQYAQLQTATGNSLAFWFCKGLTAYHYLETVVKIDEIKIERSIYEDLKSEYPKLIENYKCEVFENPAQLQGTNAPSKKICFFASNDTIIRSFKSILNWLDPSEYEVFCRPKENAAAAGKALGIDATPIGFSIPHPENYSLLILGNDWGPLERKINLDFIAKNVNTVCIQESSIDFNPTDKRMRNCSFPVFQGIATLENFDVIPKISAVIGNPRFEALTPTPSPSYKKALVNVNFTYGIFEECRDEWVSDIVSTCNELGVDYVLSQHPRDKGDLSKYKVAKSNPLMVHDSIRENSMVISRFSALLTEAICLGRPAIYYNPHGENMYYKFTADNNMLFNATNKTELAKAIKMIFEKSDEERASESDFLKKHLGNTTEGDASKYISLLFKDLLKFPPIKKASLKEKLKIRLKIAELILKRRQY